MSLLKCDRTLPPPRPVIRPPRPVITHKADLALLTVRLDLFFFPFSSNLAFAAAAARATAVAAARATAAAAPCARSCALRPALAPPPPRLRHRALVCAPPLVLLRRSPLRPSLVSRTVCHTRSSNPLQRPPYPNPRLLGFHLQILAIVSISAR
jgi:hypothetical protein